jgi:hypothetical protein
MELDTDIANGVLIERGNRLSRTLSFRPRTVARVHDEITDVALPTNSPMINIFQLSEISFRCS